MPSNNHKQLQDLERDLQDLISETNSLREELGPTKQQFQNYKSQIELLELALKKPNINPVDQDALLKRINDQVKITYNLAQEIFKKQTNLMKLEKKIPDLVFQIKTSRENITRLQTIPLEPEKIPKIDALSQQSSHTAFSLEAKAALREKASIYHKLCEQKTSIEFEMQTMRKDLSRRYHQFQEHQCNIEDLESALQKPEINNQNSILKQVNYAKKEACNLAKQIFEAQTKIMASEKNVIALEKFRQKPLAQSSHIRQEEGRIQQSKNEGFDIVSLQDADLSKLNSKKDNPNFCQQFKNRIQQLFHPPKPSSPSPASDTSSPPTLLKK